MTNMLHGVVTIDTIVTIDDHLLLHGEGQAGEDVPGTMDSGEECRWSLTQGICGEEGG